MISALSLATLLLACAHDAKQQRANDESTAAQRAEAEGDAERRADNQGRRAGDDDVDLPRRRGERDRVASREGIPERRERATEGTQGGEEAQEEVSSFDQGNNEIDLDLTQRIRKAVMDDDSLSFKAKNVKIITRDGQVTLRGDVNTAAEKEAIYKCAVSAAGAGKVQNQLQVEE